MTEAKKKLLIIEDDPGLQKQLRWTLSNYETLVAGDRESALAHIRRHEPAVVTMDLGLPPDADGVTEGMATLQQILALAPDTKVIVLTGNETSENAVKAIGMGAYDFHQKPFSPEVLNLVIQRAFYLHALQQEHRKLLHNQAGSPLPGITSRDPGMMKVCRTMEKVATSSATVLLLGESGTGKELFARALHQLSPRGARRLVAINCAAIPETLLESELFGYERGAFTGAVKQTIGKLELANEGTLFLDEVGDLPMALQAKLLRFLQERVIERIGGHKEIPVNVRIVCATHRDLKEMTAAGTFREDLYYRLSEIAIQIPPVRDRVGDAALLAHFFKNKYATEQGRPALRFHSDAITMIECHSWPGNVREIENCIKRAIIMADGPQITAEDLGLDNSSQPVEHTNLRQARDEAEYKAIVRALARADCNIAKAAELLGISRPTLYDLISRHAIKVSSEPAQPATCHDAPAAL